MREFDKRKRKNSSYSLNAFARYIGLQPSKLSEALNGKRGLSAVTGRKIANSLQFTDFEASYFICLIEAEPVSYTHLTLPTICSV